MYTVSPREPLFSLIAQHSSAWILLIFLSLCRERKQSKWARETQPGWGILKILFEIKISMPTVSCVLRSFTNNWVLKHDLHVPFRSSEPEWSQPISFQVMPWSSEFFEVISAEKVKGWHLKLWLVCASFTLLSVS